MSKLLEKCVTSGEDGYDFACPGVKGSPCGVVGANPQPFTSTGWPTKKAAMARGAQHFAEHRGDGHMQDLHEFRAEQGLGVTNDGRAVELGDL